MESVLRFLKLTGPTEGQPDTESPPVTQPAHEDEARVYIYLKKEKRVEMPSLVCAVFIKNTREINLIKTCRLVCKLWNEEASAALRTLSLVRLYEEDLDRVRQFKDLLLNGRVSPLPSPFQNFHVEVSSLSDESFTSIINLPNVTITSLRVVIPDVIPSNLRKIGALFETKGRTMTEIFLKDTRQTNSLTLMLSRRQELLKVEDDCDTHCVHKEVMQKALDQVLNFERIQIKTTDSAILTMVLTPERLKHVVLVDLFLPGSMEQRIWGFIGSCVMPSLKFLRLVAEPDEVILYSEKLVLLLKKLAPTIEDLQISFLPLTRFPVLPKLKHVCFYDWSDEFCLFSPQRFPILESVKLFISDEVQMFLPKSGFYPHTKVKIVEIDLDSISRDFYILMDYTKDQFPNLTTFKLKITAIKSHHFLAIYNAFPDLQELWLDGICSFSSLSGMSTKIVSDYLEYGLDMQRIPRQCSVTSFSKMEKLVLTSQTEDFVSNYMILHCLSKIPSLRAFTFQWNGQLSVQEVRDCLGHLEKITILNGVRFPEIIEELRELLPNTFEVGSDSPHTMGL
ncbi:unnamed protein product [Allacma fusca]|uniref:Uncharacterized protein n=1 Tax=Allacma fusca TaxID=39272 RepID=A0A8J2LEB9_9HEXA|nr:unnamed protein product [Allacma fusca]